MTKRHTNWLQDGNGSFERANQRAEQYAVTEPIEGRLGQVGVDDTGALVGVDLNESAMRTMRANSVAHYLVAAINRAQDSATTQESRRR